MSKVYDFLKECGVFYVLTINGDFPAGRPFGAVMEYEGSLYFSTADMKDVYNQLHKHSEMQIVALRPGTREWIRISGKALECTDLTIKEEMIKKCLVLIKHFPTAISEHFALFQVTNMEAFLSTDKGKEKIS